MLRKVFMKKKNLFFWINEMPQNPARSSHLHGVLLLLISLTLQQRYNKLILPIVKGAVSLNVSSSKWKYTWNKPNRQDVFASMKSSSRAPLGILRYLVNLGTKANFFSIQTFLRILISLIQEAGQTFVFLKWTQYGSKLLSHNVIQSVPNIFIQLYSRCTVY